MGLLSQRPCRLGPGETASSLGDPDSMKISPGTAIGVTQLQITLDCSTIYA